MPITCAVDARSFEDRLKAEFYRALGQNKKLSKAKQLELRKILASGREEMRTSAIRALGQLVDAAEKIATRAKSAKLSLESIDASHFKSITSTACLFHVMSLQQTEGDLHHHMTTHNTLAHTLGTTKTLDNLIENSKPCA
jgi:hypothetical protein